MNDSMMLTELDVDHIEKIIERKLEEKFQKYGSKILNAVSGIAGKLKTIHESLDILAPKVSDHEERIEKLEQLRPSRGHAAP